MKMLLKLAWRNIWRNKQRTAIVLISIVIGVVVLLLVDSLSVGMLRQMLDNQINLHITHIQIHGKGFNDDKTVKNYLPDYAKVEFVLNKSSGIKSFSKRVIGYGLVSSAYNSSGVIVSGVQSEREKLLTIVSNLIVEGRYLVKGGEILLGRELARKLNVGLGDKVILMVSDLKGNISSDVFRVVGLYESPSAEFDKVFIYITLEDAQRLFGLGDKVIEYAVLVDNLKNVNLIKEKISKELGDSYEVLTYVDVEPFLTVMIDMYNEMIWIYYLIIGVAVVFGIINVMLMSVFERIREFGILKAVGLKNGQIFTLILIEALLIGIVGTLVGLAVGVVFYIPLSKVGVDLSVFAESLAWYGSGRIIYPVLTLYTLFLAGFTIPFISVIGAIYPALKSVKFEPVEALKHI